MAHASSAIPFRYTDTSKGEAVVRGERDTPARASGDSVARHVTYTYTYTYTYDNDTR